MLSVDQASKLELLSPAPSRLTLHSFDDALPLWEKSKLPTIPNQAVKGVKRYPFFKLGKILGIETYRYLAIYDRYLLYFEEAQGGPCKGICNLDNRYIQWHKTAKGKYLLVISNTNETALLFFDSCAFWNDHKEEIVKRAIRTNFQREYNTLELLGEGSFSNVFLVRNRVNGRKYAAKKIAKFDKNNKPTKKLVVEERKILTQLNQCRHASRLVEFYEENNEYILVLEHVEGKDLLGFLKCTPDVTIDAIKVILTSILVCLKAVHSQRIIHRDIKPHNILISTDLKCKLIDFGLSLDARHPLEKNNFKKCGTVGYMAPEVFINEFSYMKPYNSKCDIFSFGIIAHMLLMDSNPIKGKSYEQSYELNRQCKIVLDHKKITEKYGIQCLNFLQKVLENNAKYRYSAEEALNCKFLQEVHEKDDKMSISTWDEKRKLSEELLK